MRARRLGVSLRGPSCRHSVGISVPTYRIFRWCKRKILKRSKFYFAVFFFKRFFLTAHPRKPGSQQGSTNVKNEKNSTFYATRSDNFHGTKRVSTRVKKTPEATAVVYYYNLKTHPLAVCERGMSTGDPRPNEKNNVITVEQGVF